jgi:hypothetical protein
VNVAFKGFKENGLCPIDIDIQREKLGLIHREIDRRPLSERNIIIPILSSMKTYMDDLCTFCYLFY